MPEFLAPLTTLLGSVLATTHAAATTAGLDGALGWVIAIALLTCAVRVVLLPFAITGARNARRAAAAAPALRALQQKYVDRRDPDSLQDLMRERRAVQREHGLSSLGWVPLLIQMPLLISLYHLIMKVSGGSSVGALTAVTVASASAASVGGVHLGSRLLSGSMAEGALVLGLALCAGLATWATQRWFAMTPAPAAGDPMSVVQSVMPWLSLIGVVAGAFFVPAGLVLYWTFSNAWTLGQQAWLRQRFA
ncbi:YidC/Oxa1 family membrane protein insertase [Calidifontibacter terrae]